MLALAVSFLLAGEPAGASVPEPSAAVETPMAPAVRPRPTDAVLRARALGLGITSALPGVVWLGFKISSTRSDLEDARAIDAGRPKACLEFCYVGSLFNSTTTPVLILAAGLVGGSMHAHGRRLGRRAEGLGATRRRGAVLVGAGVATMVGAIATFGTMLGVQRRASTELGTIAIREGGWWSLGALGITGAALTGLGHGVLRGHRDRERALRMSVAPMIGGRFSGVVLTGRF